MGKTERILFSKVLCLKSQGIPQISRLLVLLQSNFILFTPSFEKYNNEY